MTLTKLLRLQQATLKLHLDPLKLLLGSIASDDSELSSPDSFLCALGFRDCRMKFVEHMPLFIWLLVPSRRGHRELAFLSTNQIQTRLLSKDIAKGVIPSFGYDTGTNSRSGYHGLRQKPYPESGQEVGFRPEAGLRQIPYSGRSS
jgi:hypothetical protein